MIFVTVGTHEQPFDRLFIEIERLARAGADFFCQTGYSTPAQGVDGRRFLPYLEVSRYLDRAELVVSHGGPGSILPALARGTPLVLVPRQRRFGEHVDDHQVAFCRRLAADRGCPLVLDISDLGGAIAAALTSAPSVAPLTESSAASRLAQIIDAALAR